MHLKIQHFVTFITFWLITSCGESHLKLSKIEGNQVAVDSSLTIDQGVESFISPYRNRVNEILDSTLAYAPKTITKTDGAFNTSAGNLMADIILSEANPVFKSRTGKDIDLVLLNHGGIRSIISAGKVSARNAFEVMPFENNIAVVSMKGDAIRDMVSFLIASGRAHPIAGMQIVLNKDKSLKSATINGLPVDSDKTYYVATSDYLVAGGDHMGFFKSNIEVIDTEYRIRNAMIDYFKKVDTLFAEVDKRFYIEE